MSVRGWLGRRVTVVCEGTRPGASRSASRRRAGIIGRLGGALALLGVGIGCALPGAAGAEATIAPPPVYSTAPGLPDGRLYEQASPADKNGGYSAGEYPQYSLASPDGNAVLFGGTGAMGNAVDSLSGYFVARRSTAGWSTTQAIPRPIENGAFAGILAYQATLLPSADLSHLVFTTGAYGDSYVSQDPGGGNSIYLAGPDPLVSPVWLAQPAISQPILPTSLGFKAGLVGASPDLSVVYFSYEGTLLPQDASRAPNAGYHGAYGLYEWRNGTLASAGVLPDGSISPFGAVPAGMPGVGETVASTDFNNEVSEDGSRMFFVSREPSNDVLELYVRETAADGTHSVVLVSKSAITGEPAPTGPLATPNPHFNAAGNNHVGASSPYAYASPDGSQAFFESTDALTSDAPSDGLAKAYDFNVDTGSLTYLPGVAVSAILASARDGSRFIFARANPTELDLWSSGPNGGTVTQIAQLPSFSVFAARATADGSVFVFQTGAQLPGFNNASGFQQVYRYEAAGSALSCVSCPPAGVEPSGDANFANNDLVSSGGTQVDGSLGGQRAMSSDGSRVFFDSPAPLVPQDTNGRRDVYEWENGTVYLISSGTSTRNSWLRDSGGDGRDVFFTTSEGLVTGDTDGAYDVYDARVPHPGDNPPPSAVPCQGEVCQGPPSVPSLLGEPASATFSGAGNVVEQPALTQTRHKAKKTPGKRKRRKRAKKKGRKAARTRSTTRGRG
jgi:hypothetical protein